MGQLLTMAEKATGVCRKMVCHGTGVRAGKPVACRYGRSPVAGLLQWVRRCSYLASITCALRQGIGLAPTESTGALTAALATGYSGASAG